MIAILGMGLLDSNFARALMKKGETVHVWNRTFDRARTTRGRRRDAVRACRRGRARRGSRCTRRLGRRRGRRRARRGESCTRHPRHRPHHDLDGRARARSARTDITYVHAPVFMGPQNALESTGIMLLSGGGPHRAGQAACSTQMTGKVLDFGERVDAAAAFKLHGQHASSWVHRRHRRLARARARRRRSPSDEAVGLFEHFNPAHTSRCREQAHGSAANSSNRRGSWRWRARTRGSSMEESQRGKHRADPAAGDRGADGRDDRARPCARRLDRDREGLRLISWTACVAVGAVDRRAESMARRRPRPRRRSRSPATAGRRFA